GFALVVTLSKLHRGWDVTSPMYMQRQWSGIAAGARFVVSPVLLKEVCQVARAHGVPCVLAGMTPSEIHAAFQCGCEVVKVFPAATVGPGFMRELKGPLGFIPLYPTGGITLENASAFLDGGAVA